MTNKIDMTKVDVERMIEGLFSAISAPINRLADRVKKIEDQLERMNDDQSGSDQKNRD